MGQVITRVYEPIPGTRKFSDPELAYVNMQIVSREGIIYDPIDANPSNRQYQYRRGYGLLIFDASIPFNEGEKLTVTYTT